MPRQLLTQEITAIVRIRSDVFHPCSRCSHGLRRWSERVLVHAELHDFHAEFALNFFGGIFGLVSRNLLDVLRNDMGKAHVFGLRPRPGLDPSLRTAWRV